MAEESGSMRRVPHVVFLFGEGGMTPLFDTQVAFRGVGTLADPVVVIFDQKGNPLGHGTVDSLRAGWVFEFTEADLDLLDDAS